MKRVTKLFEPQDFRNVLHNRLVLRNKFNWFAWHLFVLKYVSNNLMGYDGSAIIVALSDMNLSIAVVPQSKSIFISISTFIQAGYNTEMDKIVQVEVRFIDSFRFLNMSLLKLAETVDSFPKTGQFVKSTFKDQNAFEYFKLAKMHFPYEFFETFQHYDMGLPTIAGYFSTLTGTTISQDKYDYCLNIYNRLFRIDISSNERHHLENGISCNKKKS